MERSYYKGISSCVHTATGQTVNPKVCNHIFQTNMKREEYVPYERPLCVEADITLEPVDSMGYFNDSYAPIEVPMVGEVPMMGEEYPMVGEVPITGDMSFEYASYDQKPIKEM